MSPTDPTDPTDPTGPPDPKPLATETPIADTAAPEAAESRPIDTEVVRSPDHTAPARPGFFESLKADPLTIYAATTAAFVLTLSRYHCSTGEYHRLFATVADKRGGMFASWARRFFGDGTIAQAVARATEPIADHVYWFSSSWLIFLVLPLVVARVVPGVRGRDLGLGFGDWKFGLKATAALFAVMLPFVLYASTDAAFQRQYPMSGGAVRSWPAFVTFEVLYLLYFIAWEWVHRGLLCVALYPRVGPAVIWLHTIAFAVMHAGKPELEAYGSIVAGVALGALAVRTGSFWYGALLHAAVAFTMDLASLAQTGRWPGG